MKFIPRIGLSAIVLICVCNHSVAATHSDKQIDRLFPGDTNRDCIFFTLSGVAEADPNNPNSPWFAIPRSHPNYKEQYALLLAARLSGAVVNVATTGTTLSSCGHAEVHYVEIAPP